MFVRPSPSESAFGSEEITVSVLPAVETDGELPLPFVATSVKDPLALEASVKVMVAEAPFGLMFTFETVMAAGVKVGRKANVEPVRFVPVTEKLLMVGAFSTSVGLTEVITGTARTVKLLLEVAVEPPTVTLMAPVVAPAGTVVVSWFVVAAVTVAVVPLNFTVLELGVALKFWP